MTQRERRSAIGSSALGVALAVTIAAPGAGAQTANVECLITLSAIKGRAPRFADYPAKTEAGLRPAPVVIASPRARMFRSSIRRAAASGPNFAGHYTIAAWGCGAGGLGWTIVDARTGRVSPVGGCEVAGSVDFDAVEPGTGFPQVRFRRDSRLLVLVGARDEVEDEAEGVRYYAWTGKALQPLAAYSREQSCVNRPAP